MSLTILPKAEPDIEIRKNGTQRHRFLQNTQQATEKLRIVTMFSIQPL